jgi:hypothetical protein
MARQEFTAHEAHNLFDYDKHSGAFTWKIRPCKNSPLGMRVGSIDSHGYRVLRYRGQRIACHRLAWLLVTGHWPSSQIDHINGDRSDNRFANLRDVPHHINMQNRRHAHRDNLSTGVLGVSYRKERLGTKNFCAKISIGKKSIHIGYFYTLDDARAAYISKKRELHPGFVA